MDKVRKSDSRLEARGISSSTWRQRGALRGRSGEGELGVLSARKPAVWLPVWFPLLGARWGPWGVPAQAVPIPHPSQDQHPKEGSRLGSRRVWDSQWVRQICMNVLPSSGEQEGIKEIRDSEGRALGASPPWPGPLSSPPSSLTTQVPGSSECGNVGPGGHRGSALSPGAQAALLAPQTDLCLSFLHSRDLGPVWAGQEATVRVSGSDRHPLLPWKQQQCWNPWCRLAPTAPWGCPQTPPVW